VTASTQQLNNIKRYQRPNRLWLEQKKRGDWKQKFLEAVGFFVVIENAYSAADEYCGNYCNDHYGYCVVRGCLGGDKVAFCSLILWCKVSV
jgi:hypothetical protein